MQELVKITDMTGSYGISARTLRYYEDIGLLTSTRSDDYAYRLYDGAAVQRLEQILILRKLNISIKDIQRVFSAPGSEVVLDVLGKKVSDIDEEVALLHELKEIVLEFIRQIKDADFSSDSDIKLLYEKARDIEAQLANVDYNGNPASVNRFAEVTEKLAKKEDIVRKTRFYQIWNVSDSVGACELYQRAFGFEGKTPLDEGDGHGANHIGMEINGYFVLLRPEPEPANRGGGCAVSFPSEDELRAAYDVLAQEAQSHSTMANVGWTSLCAWVTDKYDVKWFFCV